MSKPGFLELPGNVAFAGDIGGTFAGVRCAFIPGTRQDLAEAVNEFFAKIEMGCLWIRECIVPGEGMYVWYTRNLSNEEREIYEEAQMKVEDIMRDVLAKRGEEKRLLAEAEQKRVVELERLAGVGKKCEEHHAALVKEKRAAKKGAK